MDKQFQQNALKPGDAGYVYDKRVEFGNQEKVDDGWDDNEDLNDYFDDDF